MMSFGMGDALEEDVQHQMYDMRVHGIFCDAAIIIPDENVKLNVHRNVMACCSQYFRSLFTLGWKETEENEIVIQSVSSSTMEQVIRYAYLRQANITVDTVEDLLPAADRFHIFGLQRECANFLYYQLSPENCLGILNFLRFYNCSHTAEKTWKYILMNFKDIADNSQEYLQLALPNLLEILSSNSLNVMNESEVFTAIQRWVKYEYRKRKVHYPELLNTLRFTYMDTYFFNNIFLKSEVKKLSSCTHIVSSAWEAVNLEPLDIDYNEQFSCPRSPKEIIFTVGGWSSNGVVNSIETYDKHVNRWFRYLPESEKIDMESPRAYHGTVPMNGLIYVVGGFDGNRYLSSVMSFNPELKLWEERAPMYMSRCYVSVVSLHGFLYACGGFDGRQRHNSVERYDPSRNQWSKIQPMRHQRSDAGASVLNDKIYIAGGFDGQSCLDSMEMYDVKTEQWTMLMNMALRRSGVVLVTLDNDIVALGGYDGFKRLESAEYYSINKKTWTCMAPMKLGRSNFAAVVMNKKIVAIGGYDGETTSPEVEVYDPEVQSWVHLSKLNVGRSAVSACVLTDLTNSTDFTFHGYITRDRQLRKVSECHD